jgi:gamma-glutamylputrescine oxidase
MNAGFNAGLGMAQNYYLATAAPAERFAPLAAPIDVDLAIVGGGTTGLSAALHGAQRGLSVAVLEGGRVGWGASGRNGGQMIPGLRQGALALKAAYGVERAKAILTLAFEARDLVVELIERHDIACDLKTTGHLQGAFKAADAREMEAEVRCLVEDMGYPMARFVCAEEARAFVDVPFYGAVFDAGGGHMHPLNYTLGLAKAARAAGAHIYEASEVVGLTRGPSGVLLTTARGAVRARHAVLAGDALLRGLAPRVNARIMPVANYLIASEPLAAPHDLIPSDAAVSDTRFVVNYYRLTADGRLIFGGGERYSRRPPADIAAFVRPHVERVFPALRGVRIDYAWGGLVSITLSRLPHVGREGEVLFAHGYSGMGVVLSTLAGKLLVEALSGETAGFDRLAGLEPPPFPGGVALRGPLHVLGMLWYAMRDRL